MRRWIEDNLAFLIIALFFGFLIGISAASDFYKGKMETIIESRAQEEYHDCN